MKKSIFFAAGFAALAMLFVACDDGGNKKPGSEPPAPPPVIPGWEKILKIDTDPEKFSPGTQAKFQFKIAGFDYPAGAKIEFYFYPVVTNFTGQVCFRNCTDESEKWVNGKLPTTIGETVDIGGTKGDVKLVGFVTKEDEKWYKVEAESYTAGTAIGFTFYKPDGVMPVGDDVLYVKGFTISGVDEETEEPFEWEYTEEDFVYDAESNPRPLTFEVYHSVDGLRVTEVDSF